MTVKKTGGGTFDPAGRPRYFCAGGNWTTGKVTWPPYVLVAVNDLETERAEKNFLQPRLDEGRDVLLDSGIFWLTNQHKRAHGVSMDEALALAPEDIDGFEELYKRYVQLVNRYGDRLWGFIELDQGGAVNKRRTRARLEAEGIVPMPVYHPLNDGWDYFDEIACQYDRMCFGNIVQANRPTRVRLLHTMWERHRAYPDLFIHILGLTASEWVLSAPPDSCDSSTWLSPLRWPAVRTETSLLHRTADLGPRFAYDLGDAKAEGRGSAAGFNMCSDGVIGINLVWQDIASRLNELTGQRAHPAYLSGERPPSP